MKKYKILLIIAGSLSLALGVIGIFLPLLPTTPFLLLSSYCFLKSSTKLYQWLMHHRIFGSYIYNYVTYRSISMRSKVLAISLIWISITISVLMTRSVIIACILIVISLAVSWHILSLRTFKKKTADSRELKSAE
jgi:uncharacterized protein